MGGRTIPRVQRFDEPITLRGGRKLVTLRDDALYITKLPKAEQHAERWQIAAELLLLIAEHAGDAMLPRIAMMKALHWRDPQATKTRAARRQGAPDHSMTVIIGGKRKSDFTAVRAVFDPDRKSGNETTVRPFSNRIRFHNGPYAAGVFAPCPRCATQRRLSIQTC